MNNPVTLRIEMFRKGAWEVRSEGSVPGAAVPQDVQSILAPYCTQYPHRLYIDGALRAECNPKGRRNAR